jgi:hypothetical protein
MRHPERVKSPKIRSRHPQYLLILFALLFYQNCSEMTNTDSLVSEADNLPFAYVARPDTIAYMSCSNLNGSSPQGLFTYRIMASGGGNGGLAFTPEFRSATSGRSIAQRVELLADSPLNTSTQLELSIRTRDLTQIWLQNKNGLQPTVDSGLWTPQLGDTKIVTALSASNSFVNYFAGAVQPKIDISLLQAGSQESDATSTRQGLSSNTFLTLAYSNSLDPADDLLRTVPDSNGKLYGTGYGLSFGPGPGSSNTWRVIQSVAEYDLRTLTSMVSTWTCYKFQIRRPGDDNFCESGNCLDQSDSSVTAARRMLDPNLWYIHMSTSATTPWMTFIEPKGTTGDSCYNIPDTTTMPAYTYTDACNEVTPQDSSVGPYVYCPHYFTVCTRN